MNTATLERGQGVDWKEIHEKLSAPFPAEAVKTTQKQGGRRQYVTARTVMNRLDEVVGPGNWEVHHEVADVQSGSVKSRLTIYGVTREDFGDPNNPVKGDIRNGQIFKEAASDGLKRAAVLFGVGRYLYEPDYEAGDDAQEFEPPTRPKPNNTGGPGLSVDLMGLMEQLANASGQDRRLINKRLKAELNIPEHTLLTDTPAATQQKAAALVQGWINKLQKGNAS